MPQIVEASSVADYLHRYYKQDRLANVDRAYGDGTLRRFYEIDFECFGFVSTSGYDNVTGRFIAWPKYDERALGDAAAYERRLQLRDEAQAAIDSRREARS